jgi:arginine decarboxylase
MMDRWQIDDSSRSLWIRSWGAGYFDIAENGDVVVTPFFR